MQKSLLFEGFYEVISHAMLLETLDTRAVWSVARGLARNVESYNGNLAACDRAHRNDLDGHGHISEEALGAFAEFFLRVCIDQVNFMENLMQPDRLRARILLWSEEEIRLNNLPPKAGSVLEAVLYRGELPRGELLALGTVMPGALFRRWWRMVCWPPRARGLRCDWSSRRRWPPDGCRGCFLKGRVLLRERS